MSPINQLDLIQWLWRFSQLEHVEDAELEKRAKGEAEGSGEERDGEFREFKPHATRVDVGWNDMIGLIDLDEVEEAATSSEVSGFKSYGGRMTPLKSMSTGEKKGDMITFGARGSDGGGKYMRIYDKTLESKGKIVAKDQTGEEFNVIRMEVEFGDHWAQMAFRRLAKCRDVREFAQTMANLLTSSVDFLEKKGKDRHKNRRDRLDWWQAVRDRLNNEDIEISCPRPVPPLQKSLEYYLKTAAGVLAASYVESHKSGVRLEVLIFDAMRHGARNINKRRAGIRKNTIDPVAVAMNVRAYFEGKGEDGGYADELEDLIPDATEEDLAHMVALRMADE
ncbi:MAG TPA: replication initiation factor domain-containing protein [Tepidisphaeraceae bacterium]|nr:replication initiation factor domain-containing protein [Tepidisphaeraceae bacterium]